MFKLNTKKGHEFLEFLAPINSLLKKKLYQLATEIKPIRRNSKGLVVRSSSLPKQFWFKDYDSNTNLKKKNKYANYHRNQNPIYFKRKETFELLQNYQNRASTPLPCRKWKKYRNLFLPKMCHEWVKQKFKETLNLVMPQVSPPKSQRSSFMLQSGQTLKIPEKGVKIIKLKKLSRMQSDKPEHLNGRMSTTINQELTEICCSQSNYNNSDIQEIPPLPSHRFFQDSFRLYGLDSQMSPPKNKLKFLDSNHLVESQETRCNDGSQTAREKTSNYRNKNLLNLIQKQKLIQQQQQQQQQSKTISPIRNKTNSQEKTIKIVNTYFPSLKKINIRL